MRILTTLFALIFATLTLSAQVAPITPIPASSALEDATFDATQQLDLYIAVDGADVERLMSAAEDAGLCFKRVRRHTTKRAHINLDIDTANIAHDEGYTMQITHRGIDIAARTPAGLFYALQSLRQMLESDAQGRLPLGTISDYPRFDYRGVLIDVSRHFRTVDFLKRQIDMMARLKLNRLHLHLTDAAGWRIEVESYPRLTSYAAWRTHRDWKSWTQNGCQYCDENSAGAEGGYLSKAEARELVAYAADRYIVIIPEIEMPGHSEEVLAAYPELKCTNNPASQSDLCIGKEATFEMMEAILDEVIEIFPSEYIHIGGDECGKHNWKLCDDCQRRMREEGLDSVDELQSYMIERMERYLNERGRQIIGWDEILQGGLAPNATVMSWRGEEGGFAAAKAGHDAIMSPHGYCYIDAPQDAPHTQPISIGGYLPLEKVYSYDPAPATMADDVKRHIKGVQANLWAEYIVEDSHYEHMLWPRAIAIAEVGWSLPANRDFDNFRSRALSIVERMQAEGYTPFDLSREIGNRPESKEDIDHLARGKKITYLHPSRYYAPQYAAAGDATLTDGKRGTWTYADKRWQGFLGRGGVDVVVDLEAVATIRSISADFMQICGPGVFMPSLVEIFVSLDGDTFTKIADIPHEIILDELPSFKSFGWQGEVEARYVRYKAHRSKYSGFLFTDELIIK